MSGSDMFSRSFICFLTKVSSYFSIHSNVVIEIDTFNFAKPDRQTKALPSPTSLHKTNVLARCALRWSARDQMEDEWPAA
jgi:hypothetical protein